MQLRVYFLTALALTAAFLSRGDFRELNDSFIYKNSTLYGDLERDCILASGRFSCVNFAWVEEECGIDLPNNTYTVHFLLGPMLKADSLLNQTLPASNAETEARWYIQNRSTWDESLLDLARGRNSFYDGLILDPAIVPEMVASKALLDLEPFLATDRWAGQWPGILSVLRWQVAATKSSMLPLGAAAIVLHYRADVLSKHRLPVPQTWEQLLVAAGAVHGRPNGATKVDPEFYGFCTLPYAGCHADSFELLAIWASFIQTHGHGEGAFFDPETFTPLVHNAGMRAALLYFQQIRAFAPPSNLTSLNECNSMYGTAAWLYEAGKCAFQLAPHPSHKRNMLLSTSEDVKNFSRVTWLPGATSIFDRWTRQLVACGPSNCPFAKAVPRWPDQEKVSIAVLSGNSSAAAAAVDAAVSATRAAADLPSSRSFMLANMAPVLGLGPLGLGINNFTSLKQKAHSLTWLRRVTDPVTVWELVVSPDTPLAPFRYEHFSPSNLWHWIEAGYDETAVQSYLDLSYAVLTHGNLVSYPMALQRMMQYRMALHAAVYSLATSDRSVDTVMEELATAVASSFGPTAYGFGTLRLQYLASIGRQDLLAAPAPPPPPPPPQMRYIVGREIRPQGVIAQTPVVAVIGSVGSVAVAGVLMMVAFFYKRLMVERGWGRSKDPGVGTETTLVVTDIEGSTVLWEELDALVMDAALNLHHETVRRVIAQWSGYESVTEGDSFTVAFHTADAAVGFSLHVQSELMDQPWPPEVLAHEACRPVYVVGTKRLRHLAAKAATARPTPAIETLESEAPGASGRSNTLFGRNSGTGVVPVKTSPSSASAALPPRKPIQTFRKAVRRLDALTGLPTQLRRSMSFISRPASGNNSVQASLLTVALAGGGSGTAIIGGGGSASAAMASASAAAYSAGSVHAMSFTRRAATGNSVLLEAAVPYGNSGVNSSRNSFDHFLPYNAAAALPPRFVPSGSAGATAGSLSMSLSLAKLPVGFTAANASGVGGNAAGVAGAGFVFGAPSVGGQPMVLSSTFQDSDEQKESRFLALPAAAHVASVDTGGEGDADGGGGGMLAGLRIERCENPPPPARASSIRAASVSALASMPPGISYLQVARMGQFTGVASVPEEPSLSPSPPLSHQIVRRTQSTMVVTGSSVVGAVSDNVSSGGTGGAGVDRSPTLASASQLRATASVPCMLGPHTKTRSPLKSFVEKSALAASGRCPSRLADPPPSIYRPSQDDDHNPAGGGFIDETLQGSSVQGSLPETGSHLHVQAGTLAGGAAKESPLIKNGHRERHGLEDDAGGPTGRSIRGWRSWTGTSLGFLRRMQRSFRHVTYAAAAAAAAATPSAGAAKISFPGTRSGDAGCVGDEGATATGPATVPSMGPEAQELVSREGAGWEVESRSSSHSHATPNSCVSQGSNIQSTLQLQPSRHGRRGGAAATGKMLYEAPSTYGSELRATWTELPCNLGIDPATVGAVLVFRGFRVRCGMHSGLSNAAEVNRHHPSGRTRYSGPALMCAKAMSDAAHGGMVFASRHTVALCPAQFLASRVVLWRLGDHVLGSPRLPATLYQLSNTALVLRAALQRPLTRTTMPLGLGLLDAPLTVVACAAIRLASKTLLEQADPAVSIEAASVFQAFSYQYARLHGGYIAQLGAGRATCIFPDAYRAALWAALVASGMASYAWSRELLTTEQCGVWNILDSQGRQVQVARGPRIQAVVHFGAVTTSLHPLTGQLSYEGGAVDTTMRVLNELNTTGVVATLEAAASLRRYRPADAARAAAQGVAGLNGSNTSTGQPPSHQMRSSFKCRTEVEGASGGGDGDGTGSASQRSSAATWRETIAPIRPLQHLHHHHHYQLMQQPQEGPIARSRSSAEHLASLGRRASRDVGGSSSGADHGGGGSGRAFGRLLSHAQPPRIGGTFPSGRSRVIVPRRASGPILGRSGAASTSLQTNSHEGMMAAAAAAASSLSGRKVEENLRGASPVQRGTVPRATSAAIPVGTDSANTSGTDGTDGGTGGTGGAGGGRGSRDSRMDSQIDSNSTAEPFAAAARHISTQQLSLNLSAIPAFRTVGAGASTAGGAAADTVGGACGGVSGGDAAARAAALTTAGGGICNDSLLLLLTTSSELQQTGGAAASGGAGGGGRRDYGNVSYSGGSPLLGWMISGGLPLGSTVANAILAIGTRQGHLASQLESNIGCASDLRADGSTVNESSTPPGAMERLQLPVAGDWGNRFISVDATSAAADAGGTKGKLMGPDSPQPKLQAAGHGSSPTSAVATEGHSGDAATSSTDWCSRSTKDFMKTAATGSPQPYQAGGCRARLASAASVVRAEMDRAVGPRCGAMGSMEAPPFPLPPPHGSPVGSLPSLSAADGGDAVSMPAGAPSVLSNDASDCRPPAGGAGMSHSASSGDSVSPSSALSHRRTNARVMAAASTATINAAAAAAAETGATAPSLRPAGRQSTDSTAISSTQPSDSAEPSSDPDAVPSTAMVFPMPMKPRPPQPHPRWLRPQNSARDSTTGAVLGPERVYQSFTFGQKRGSMARPRLQDLLSVNPYASVTSTALAAVASEEAVAKMQPSEAGGGRDNNFFGQAGSRLGDGGATVYCGAGGRVATSTQRGLPPLPPDQEAPRSWGPDLPSPPSTRTGYGGGQGSSSLEALIRGPHGRISRSFTFTTHRRSPLAVSSYAGDPEIGAVTSGNGAAGASGGMRPMSSLSRVFYGSGAAIGLVSREGVAVAGSGYDASRETTPRGSSHGPQGVAAAVAAVAAAAAAAIGFGSGNSGTQQSRPRDAIPAVGNTGAGSVSGGVGTSGDAGQVYQSPSMSRGTRGQRSPLPPPQAGGSPSAAGAQQSGSYCPGGLQLGAASASGTPTAASVSVFALPPDYPHSSNSAGTLPMSLNSTQVRTSTGEYRASGHDCRGSGGTSAASANTSPLNMDASAAAIHSSTAMMTVHSTMGAAGHFSGILARVKGSMAKARSKSLSRAFASVVAPLDTGLQTVGTPSRGESGAGSLRTDPAMTGTGSCGDASGASTRLPATLQFPSGSSGGGIAAAASRTLRGLMPTEKLPTLPEGSLMPLAREIRHLRLRLVPLRPTARAAMKGSPVSTVQDMQAGDVVTASVTAEGDCGETAAASKRPRHQWEQLSYATCRAAEYMQVYRVMLVTRESTTPALATLQPSVLGVCPMQAPGAAASCHSLSLPPPQGTQQTQGSGSGQVQLRRRSETEPEHHTSVSISGASNGQSRSLRPKGEQVTSEADVDASQSMPIPFATTTRNVLGDEEEVTEAALVSQFLSGFADLADPQLMELWAENPERSLLQDQRPGNVAQLRARLATQVACDAVLDRDNFLF